MEHCKLCKENLADKTNSHIIPKFMCKRLFEDTKPRYSVQISKTGKHTKLQDSPKENNILCRSCEKRIEFLETYFSKVFIEINSLGNAKRNYKIDVQANQEVLVCQDLHPTLFKLFIYSLIWRSSISQLIAFTTFKLPEIIEEEIRLFLNTNLKLSHKELIDSLDSINVIPNYHICMIKPKNKTRGIFTVYEFAENSFAIYTVDYVVFFYISKTPHIAVHEKFSNNSNSEVRIVIGNDEQWKELNSLIVTKMLNSETSGNSL